MCEHRSNVRFFARTLFYTTFAPEFREKASFDSNEWLAPVLNRLTRVNNKKIKLFKLIIIYYFMKSFDDLWLLLEVRSEYEGLKRSCEKIWSGFNSARQDLIYDTIAEKKSLGEFVDYNPYYAIQKNANPQPKFLDGFAQDDALEDGIPLVIVRFNRRCYCCTRATMEAHELEFVRDVLPLPKPQPVPENELVPFQIDYNQFFHAV